MPGIDATPNSDDLVDIGEDHHKAGRLHEAESFYRKALEIDPDHPGALYYLANIAYEDCRLQLATEFGEKLLRGDPNDAEAWHLLGVVALKKEDPLHAQECFKKAITIQPAYTQAHYSLGNALINMQDNDEALVHFQRAASLNPVFAEAHRSIGNIFKIQGKFYDALSSYQHALRLQPECPLSYATIGEVLLAQKRFDEAIAIFQQAIARNASSALIHTGLGVANIAINQIDTAIASYQLALAMDPQFSMAHFNLGLALLKQDKADQAIASLQNALALEPHNNKILERLANTFYVQGNIEKAAQVYQQWLTYEPNNPIARHHLAACGNEAVPKRAEDAYIENTFDEFADTFDDTLAQLKYCGPQLVTEALRRECGVAHKQFSVLDAGCGTGLCGPLVIDYAAQLTGVDLSEGMLAKAKLRDVYDSLIKAELTAYLQSQVDVFDVILSADTLIYFGALESLFTGARAAMRDNGYMFLTAEALLENDQDSGSEIGYHLNPHGRYSHSEAYLRHTLSDAGFVVIALESAILRHEYGRPVPGHVISCRVTTHE